jgi:hypothetical protein
VKLPERLVRVCQTVNGNDIYMPGPALPGGGLCGQLDPGACRDPRGSDQALRGEG